LLVRIAAALRFSPNTQRSLHPLRRATHMLRGHAYSRTLYTTHAPDQNNFLGGP